ncbi:hypothetical protein D3C76_1704500 [compost metagenome]
MEAFELVLMEDDPCGTNDSPLEIEVAFIRCKQVAAIVRRDPFGKLQCVTNMIIHRNPARCRRT